MRRGISGKRNNTLKRDLIYNPSVNRFDLVGLRLPLEDCPSKASTVSHHTGHAGS